MSELILSTERDGYINGRKIIWQPTKGSQELAMTCQAQQILYSSGRGAGKSTVQLMRFRKTVGQGYGSYWNGLIIDRGYKNLDDLVHKSKQLFTPFNDGAKFYSSKGDLRWVWKTGETLLFRAVEDEDDYQKLHGSSACLYVNDSVTIRNKGVVKIKEVKVGDEILTCEGYKKITRVFPTIKRECNRTLVFDNSGKFIGSQVQSTDHSILTAEHTFAKFRALSQDDLLYLHTSFQLHEVLKSHQYENQENLLDSDSVYTHLLAVNTLWQLLEKLHTFLISPQFESDRLHNQQENQVDCHQFYACLCSDYLQMGYPIDKKQTQELDAVFHTFLRYFQLSFLDYNLLKSRVELYLQNKLVLSLKLEQGEGISDELLQQMISNEQPQTQENRLICLTHLSHLLQYNQSRPLEATLLQGYSEFDELFLLNKINLKNSYSYLLQQLKLLQLNPFSELENVQREDASFGLETTKDFLNHYFAYRGQYDVLLQSELNIFQDIVRQQPDVLQYIHDNPQMDVRDIVDNDNLSPYLSSYAHPYSNEQREVVLPFHVCKSLTVSCGILDTIDIEVDDCNNYITSRTGLSNKNCYIGFNELTQYPDLAVYDLVSSLNRSGFVPSEHPLPNGTILPEIPMCIFSTTNPSGISGLEVRKRFVDPGRNGEIVKTDIKIFNPRTQQEEIYTKTQCHIFGSYKENDKLDASYVADLEAITDPIRRRFWLIGDWSACGEDGGMFNDVWDKTQHVIEPFEIPKGWEITRCMDWGDSSPSSIGYFAESNGEDIRLKNGKTKSTVKGDLFHIGEIYTCLEGYNNRGIKMLPHDLATMITKYELSQGIYDRVVPGVADTAIFSLIMGNSVAGMMDKPITIGDKVYPGVKWRRLDSLKKAGSRVDGIKLIRERFANSIVTSLKPYRDRPGLFIFNTCKYFIEIMPMMMRDSRNPDDVDGRNDHICDMGRYKLLSMNTGSKSGKTTGLN